MTTAAILASLLLSLCLAALQQADAYDHEANRLLEFINSGVSSSQHGWDNLSRAKKASSVYLGPQDGLMEADKVDALPGQPQGVDFDQYAGYVTVDPSSGRALFYYFAESPDDTDTKPLILWLNGGPGCSSLGGGAMVELGPFRANSDGKTLYANSHSWNNVANVIFLESPAGVGFSYSNTTSDYKLSGDTRTADDTYTFLVNWLERFPRYKGRDFFVAGESYGGHYIPELASTILTNNKIYNNNTINLKGIAIGNGLFDVDTNNRATFDYYWTHALISDEAHSAIRSKCTFAGQNFSADCASALRSADAEIGNIDRYDIYAPLCRDSSGSTGSTTRMMEVDPCSGDYASSYLNLPEVQRALHANVTGLPYPWSACSSFVGGHGNWTDAPTTMLPIIKDLIASGISLWLYSGDQDSVCPVTSTRYSINTLGLPVESPWRPWYDDGEVGGYVVAYEGLTFVTVRGAGHMVPSYQPERALTLVSSFLGGKLPPPA